MSLQYLGVNVEPFEIHLKKACHEARRLTRNKDFINRYGMWRIADEGLPEMPSAKKSSEKAKKGVEDESPWKFDCWLPRAIAKELDYPVPQYDCEHEWNDWNCNKCGGHWWWIILSEYSNSDSLTTYYLWPVHKKELHAREQWPIYSEKLKQVQIVHELGHRGLSTYGVSLDALENEYRIESQTAKDTCLSIAKKYNYDLILPKSGANGSLREFIFDVMKVPVSKTTDKGSPSMDKEAMEGWLGLLDKGSDNWTFIRSLKAARKRDTALGYMASYRKYQLPKVTPFDLLAGDTALEDWYTLYCSVNPTATGTTRLSCSNPNLQQVSKQETMCEECLGEGCETCGYTGEDLHSMRSIFRPAPGREMWSMDAKNIELRIPAYESGEDDLIALFEKSDEPPFYGSNHMLNFSIIYDDIWRDELRAVGIDKVGPHCKKKYASGPYAFVKAGGLAMQYQCGKAKADATFRRPGFDKLKSKFSRLDALNRKCVSFAKQHGYVETIPDKTIDPHHGYRLYCSRHESGHIKDTVPLNYRVQGSAGWWMIKGMNRCEVQLREWRLAGCDCWMALTVHDELVFDFPKGTHPTEPWRTNLPKIRKLQMLLEEGGDDIGIPTPTSCEYHAESWAKGLTI